MATTSPPRQEFVHGQLDVSGDLAQQRRRDVASRVERHSRRAPVGVAELLVRTALTDLDEAVRLEE